MSEAATAARRLTGRIPSFTRWRNRLVASRRFQRWASSFPLTRRIARAEGQAMFDLVAGFVHSQILFTLVKLRILDLLAERPQTADSIAVSAQLPRQRAEMLLRAGTALGLIEMRRGGRFVLSRRGAALLGVPGLAEMVGHHDILYRDLADPVAFFRGETEPDLAAFWPYVFGADGAADPDVVTRYSRLMADSQLLVAEETLRAVSFAGSRHILDVGGGSGVFLVEAARAYPEMQGTVFDLPGVKQSAEARFREEGMSSRLGFVAGSFRDDRLPGGADTICLNRVLYDHADDTVRLLLSRVCRALPKGGRIVISEPMLGDRAPERAGDAYFAVYTAAMGTGRTRSPAEIGALLTDTGFTAVKHHPTHRRFVTSVVSAHTPDETNLSK